MSGAGAATGAVGATSTPPTVPGPDVAALEARLRQLEAREAEAGKRTKDAAAVNGTADFAMRTDNWLVGRRILDREATEPDACRRQCAQDVRCIGFDHFTTEKGGICRHYDQVERRDARPGWRSGVKPEWVQQPTVAAAPEASAGNRGPSFVVRLDQRIAGDPITAPPGTANCESRCRADTGCIAWSLSRQGQCELFARVERLYEERQWRSGLRADVWAQMVGSAPVSRPAKPEREAPSAAVPPIEPRAGRFDGAASGLTLDDGVRVDGNPLGEPARAPSPDACRQRCAETAGCVAFRHGKKIPVSGQCHLFDRVDRRQEDLSWRSGVAASR